MHAKGICLVLLVAVALSLLGCISGQQPVPTPTPAPTAVSTPTPAPSPTPSVEATPSGTPVLEASPTPGGCFVKHATTKIMQTGMGAERVIRGPLVLGIGESINASEVVLTLADVISQNGTLVAVYNLTVRGEPRDQVSAVKDERLPLQGTANYYLAIDEITALPCATGGLPAEWNATLDSTIDRIFISGDSITAVTKTAARDRAVYRYSLSGQKRFEKAVGKCTSFAATPGIVAVAGCLDYNTSLSIRMFGDTGNEVLNRDIRSYYGLLLYWTDTSIPGGLFGQERTYGCTSVHAPDDNSAAFTYYYKRNLGADWSNGTVTFDSSGQQTAADVTHLSSAPGWADQISSPCPTYSVAGGTSATIGGKTYTADNTPYNIRLRVLENGTETMSVGLSEPISFVGSAGGDRLVVASGKTLLVFRVG